MKRQLPQVRCIGSGNSGAGDGPALVHPGRGSSVRGALEQRATGRMVGGVKQVESINSLCPKKLTICQNCNIYIVLHSVNIVKFSRFDL